jgi:glyoxylase-like metal-dependent hydrolase (beta-lactamase superfamily II)
VAGFSLSPGLAVIRRARTSSAAVTLRRRLLANVAHQVDSLRYPDSVTEAPLALDPQIRRFRCGDEVDTFVVETARWLVIVDTHSTPALARQLAAQCVGPGDVQRLLVVNTHADYDHAWGNQVFGGHEAPYPAPIIGHELCAERLSGDEGRVAVATRRELQPGRFDDLVLTPPDLTVGDGGLTIHGGDLTLVLLHTPGHTDDHFSVWIPELRVVLAGDVAEHPFPHIDTLDGIGQARASLVHLERLDPLFVLPCHGDTTDPALLERNIAYLDAVAADPTLSLAEAAGIAGLAVDDLDPLYHEFHADALAASKQLP